MRVFTKELVVLQDQWRNLKSLFYTWLVFLVSAFFYRFSLLCANILNRTELAKVVNVNYVSS